MNKVQNFIINWSIYCCMCWCRDSPGVDPGVDVKMIYLTVPMDEFLYLMFKIRLGILENSVKRSLTEFFWQIGKELWRLRSSKISKDPLKRPKYVAM